MDFSSLAQLFCPQRFEVHFILLCVHLVEDPVDVPISLEASRLNAPLPPFSEMVLKAKQKFRAIFLIVIVKMHASLDEICATADIKELWNVDIKMTEVGLV